MSETNPIPDRSLLVVEDNPTMASVVCAALWQRGFDAVSCGSVAEARERIDTQPPRFALLDLRLPDGSGLQLVQRLRRARSDATIVVLTGFANVSTAIEAIKLGADNYLCKPVDTDVICAALRGVPPDRTGPESEPMTSVPDVEHEHILRVLTDHNQNISATARALGMHRRTLQRKLARTQDPD
jgi:two-component system response regulator RegA